MLDFRQIEWNAELEGECRALVRKALEEDLAGQQDWTTVAIVPPERKGRAAIVARESGVAAGLLAIPAILAEADFQLSATVHLQDGQPFAAGAALATMEGKVRDLLTLERTLLNLLGRLLGIATLTTQYVAEVSGTSAHVYDTRKTTPGWRLLEKYAVRCGGGRNHRLGLYDAILIKDNHLAQRSGRPVATPEDAVSAVTDARRFLETMPRRPGDFRLLLEVEVDSLAQLKAVLPVGPDIVLLDNMRPGTLREAVQMRNTLAPQVELEASGGVRLETIREIAATGVERISAGALTHSARALDIGLDWQVD